MRHAVLSLASSDGAEVDLGRFRFQTSLRGGGRCLSERQAVATGCASPVRVSPSWWRSFILSSAQSWHDPPIRFPFPQNRDLSRRRALRLPPPSPRELAKMKGEDREMEPSRLSRIRRALGMGKDGMSSMGWLSTGGSIPVQQTQLAPDGLEFCEDISQAQWIEESLLGRKLRDVDALMPRGFSAYARIFHPAYLGEGGEQPVRWSTVASWTGRTIHPQMQFKRIAGLSEEPKDVYKDPLWGRLPQRGSIPQEECRTLMNVLREFTTTPDRCFFCLWEGYGNIDTRLYKAGARVKAPGRDYLLFRGPLDSAMSFWKTGWSPSGETRRTSSGLKTVPGAWQLTSTCSTPTPAEA